MTDELRAAVALLVSNWDAWMSEAPPEWVCPCTRASVEDLRAALENDDGQ